VPTGNINLEDPAQLVTENQLSCGSTVEQIADDGGITAALQRIVADDEVRYAYDGDCNNRGGVKGSDYQIKPNFSARVSLGLSNTNVEYFDTRGSKT